MAKINVLTVTSKTHIPLDPGSLRSLQEATAAANGLIVAASKLGETTSDTRLNRVPAPEPESEPEGDELETMAEAPDNLDVPDNLRRVPKPAAAK